MRSIWTRVRGYEETAKADPVQSQLLEAGETGGGEGSAQPTQIPVEASSVDMKAEVTTEVKPDGSENKPVEKLEDNKLGNNEVNQNNVKENGDWQQREQALLKKIEELEKVKTERTEDGFKLELKVREEEIDLLKARVHNLETELQAALSKPSGKNHEMIENIKQQHEELLSKARGMIFDKTKMVKNQELQIEALTTQVQSLKDINVITKDLLEIRNSEVKAMEDRLMAMEARFKAEKDRYGLVLQRAQTSTTLNDDLKKEYETQLAIFKELRQKYEQRVQALVAENAKLKELAAQKAGTSG
ncbi:epidermal growth factor receptor substrate 15 homolog isoform X1 [Helicoverpa armigera]|uniref:epidermal growth factor receptor substrate 15 homolog isoform X1 n=1 Tax=Helicoverpa armigera TaxID=29058 RepID=UPI0021110F7A|nr:epidermal growth factor receptor substrate 15 homolog isoform X1 [Helicoverpa armigera]